MYNVRTFRAKQDTSALRRCPLRVGVRFASVSASRRCPLRPVWAYFLIMTDDVLYIILLYYTLTCQNEKITSDGVSFYNFFVTGIRSVDQQRNSPPKTLTSLSNRVR